MSNQPTIFDDARLTVDQSVEITVASLIEYGSKHDVWAVAFSGGKDSTTLVTLVVHLIETGRVQRPRKLIVLYGDTRMELLPLWLSAQAVMDDLAKRDWIECRTVMAEMDQRFFVYMLGRGVPPPNNNTLRWCTAQIKVEPMERELRRLAAEVSNGGRNTGTDGDQCAGGVSGQTTPSETNDDRLSKRDGSDARTTGPCPSAIDPQTQGHDQRRRLVKPLMLIGVRLGESAVRDARIALACGRNGAECGQGWYQRDLPDAVCDKLSPILHWRVCLVWDWLANTCGPAGHPLRHNFPTHLVAYAYGAADESDAAELGARTGCIGCPLAEKETALDGLLTNYATEWGYLAPLKGLRPIYRFLREPKNRLRQPPGEARKDGTLISNQNRMGPLTMDARRYALNAILAIQTQVNIDAVRLSRPLIDLLNTAEVARIEELMAAGQWPNGWTGDEPIADELYEDQYADGTRQLLLPILPGGVE